MFKKVILTLCFVVHLCNSDAQFYKAVLPSPEFNSALEKIVLDFRYNFKNIKVGAAVSQGEVDTYESAVTLPGATNCVIYQFHSAKDTTAVGKGFYTRAMITEKL